MFGIWYYFQIHLKWRLIRRGFTTRRSKSSLLVHSLPILQQILEFHRASIAFRLWLIRCKLQRESESRSDEVIIPLLLAMLALPRLDCQCDECQRQFTNVGLDLTFRLPQKRGAAFDIGAIDAAGPADISNRSINNNDLMDDRINEQTINGLSLVEMF